MLLFGGHINRKVHYIWSKVAVTNHPEIICNFQNKTAPSVQQFRTLIFIWFQLGIQCSVFIKSFIIHDTTRWTTLPLPNEVIISLFGFCITQDLFNLLPHQKWMILFAFAHVFGCFFLFSSRLFSTFIKNVGHALILEQLCRFLSRAF